MEDLIMEDSNTCARDDLMKSKNVDNSNLEMMRESIYYEPIINAEEVLADWTGSPSTTSDSTPYIDDNMSGDIIMEDRSDNNSRLVPGRRKSNRARAWKVIVGWLPGRALRPEIRVDTDPMYDLPISREQAEEILGVEQYQEMMKKKKERQAAATRRRSRLSLPWRRSSSPSLSSRSSHGHDGNEYIRKSAPLLPPMLKQDKGKNTLVLDMDETLVCAVFHLPCGDSDLTFSLLMESGDGCMLPVNVYVSKRPFVDMFLRSMARAFEVVVFTAGVRSYADPIIDMLDPTQTLVRHRLYRGACTPAPGGLVKDLSLLGRDLRRVVIMDNTPYCYSLQPQNALPISSFLGNKLDRKLLDRIPFLLAVSKETNVIPSLENFA